MKARGVVAFMCNNCLKYSHTTAVTLVDIGIPEFYEIKSGPRYRCLKMFEWFLTTF